MNTPTEAGGYPKRNLELVFCTKCGFLFNDVFDSQVQEYSTNFEESQHFSGTFNAFARELAVQIANKCDLQGKHVLEIGCGKGEFLLELCEIAGCTGLGIDPGYRPERLSDKPAGRVEFITDFFGPRYAHLEPDVILCRHTLEHIGPTAEFVRSIREMIGDREDVVVVFETPDAERVLGEGAFWDIYYEHCSYFSAGTHARLFRQERFEVTDLELVYESQYIVQYCRPASGLTQPALPLERDLERMRGLAAGFPTLVHRTMDHWRDVVRQAGRQGRRVVLWGGGSKGVAFLTTLGVGEDVHCVVDVNPYKQGKFMPGTGHPVVSPESLVDCPPDLVIVMNPIYLGEIGEQLKALGLNAELAALR
ncbi:MAG: class I SAM-dependent methyltransferase [Rhodospirillales bacterium]|nr:class I SAM-dependent methyltransferase [Rhodospirillales bacterium]MDH3792821.1 class I SAM-dependent methyltransferase [Rhodospirillales bacterium]MDH3911340.1 class I SAM-dependent methyltransferase [Rhodospirillales bacterium]MDH3920611.1 class I SAM-dependent methyltransferase [Rhodospirillales bacterium]MDH3968191.1 class I SAM-dependent methyltransferase [Rhodospirillales bacterium]